MAENTEKQHPAGSLNDLGVRYGFRMLTGKREKLNLIEMSREATVKRELYREFGLE